MNGERSGCGGDDGGCRRHLDLVVYRQAEEELGLRVDGLEHIAARDVDPVDVPRECVAGPEGQPVGVEGDGEELSGTSGKVSARVGADDIAVGVEHDVGLRVRDENVPVGQDL